MKGSTERLESILGYHFADEKLLQLALTHRSCGSRNNERLEFLGDSIVNHVIAEALYQRFEVAREGELSRMRAQLVKGESLAELARELELGDFVRLGPGEMKSGGFRRDSILADTFESVVGAILRDGGVDSCRERLLHWFADRLTSLSPEQVGKDAKTRLQEFLQSRGRPLPEYLLVGVTGADHSQEFTVACRLVGDGKDTRGEGSSRRRAEQAAASAALLELGVDV